MNESENEFSGLFTQGDYKAKLNEIIDDLFTVVKAIPTEVIIEKVRLLTDTYVHETGYRPDVSALDRLSSLILSDELTDPNGYKMTQKDYPLLSDTQQEHRYKRETPLNWADEVGSDGFDYRPQTRGMNRKMRDVHNGHLRDKKVHARNKERRRRYNAFKRGKVPGVLNVKITDD